MRRALQLALIAGVLALALAPLPPAWVERVYARGAYPAVQPRLTGLSNRVPIALFDVCVLGILAGVGLLWMLGLRRAPRGRRARAVGGLLLDTLTVTALVYVWFLAAWGLNYQREPLRSRLDFDDRRITAEALHRLALLATERLNQLHGRAAEGGWPPAGDAPAALERAFAAAERDLAMSWRIAPARPKRTLFDWYLRRVSVDGLTDPFFLETLTNQTLLPFERPFVVAHEWAHLAGYANESEANFLGWLACMRGGPSLPVQRLDLAVWNSGRCAAAGRSPRRDRPSAAGAPPGPARHAGAGGPLPEPGGQPRRICGLRPLSEGEPDRSRRSQLRRGDSAAGGDEIRRRRRADAARVRNESGGVPVSPHRHSPVDS